MLWFLNKLLRITCWFLLLLLTISFIGARFGGAPVFDDAGVGVFVFMSIPALLLYLSYRRTKH